MVSKNPVVLFSIVLIVLGIGGCNFPHQRPGAYLPTGETTNPSIHAPENIPPAEDAAEQLITPGIPRTKTSVSQLMNEVAITLIPIDGISSLDKAEISGMTWHEDRLLILPQYPHEHTSPQGSGSIFSLQKSEILAYLAGSIQGPLEIDPIPIFNSNIAELVPGYEGYEAISILGNRVYLSVEANYRGVMQGYIIEGIFSPEDNSIFLDTTTLSEIPTPIQIFNAGYESLLVANGQVVSLFEANGRELNPDPIAFVKEKSSPEFFPISMEPVEYRLTDATDIDRKGRFWVMNVYFPIEFWYFTATDPLIDQFGQGVTHAASSHIERLLELKYNDGQISLSGRPPLQLELEADVRSRNWEALVRLNEIGFLAMTDTYPGTILAYIPSPGR